MTNGALLIAIVGFSLVIILVAGTFLASRDRPARPRPPAEHPSFGIEDPKDWGWFDEMPRHDSRSEPPKTGAGRAQ